MSKAPATKPAAKKKPGAPKRKPRTAGRPAGGETTRAEILKHARIAFATQGYVGASVRAIAASAGVDPSTVIHFFATKDGVFQAVVEDIVPVTAPLIAAFERRATGEELVRTYLTIWEDEAANAAMRAVVRTSFGSDDAMGLLRDTMMRGILKALSWADPLAAELAMMQLIGLGLGRFLARLPKLGAADVDAIAKRMGPCLDSVLTKKPLRTPTLRSS